MNITFMLDPYILKEPIIKWFYKNGIIDKNDTEALINNKKCVDCIVDVRSGGFLRRYLTDHNNPNFFLTELTAFGLSGFPNIRSSDDTKNIAKVFIPFSNINCIYKYEDY